MSQDNHTDEERSATTRILVLFAIATLAAVGFAVVYSLDLGTQALGGTLALALVGLGAGLIVWSKRLMPQGPFVEHRRDVRPSDAEEEAAVAEFEQGRQGIARRRLLGRAFGAAAGVTGISALFTLRSIGDDPRPEILETPWREGVRAVDAEGSPIRPGDLATNGWITAFPEGHLDAADAQAILIRVPEENLVTREPASVADRGVPGLVCFSKICTHAGCPISQYQAQAHVLVCPCHQASFDVLEDAKPVFGPAPHPLPRLPLGTDAEGYVVALGGFAFPVGPAYWSYDR